MQKSHHNDPTAKLATDVLGDWTIVQDTIKRTTGTQLLGISRQPVTPQTTKPPGGAAPFPTTKTTPKPLPPPKPKVNGIHKSSRAGQSDISKTSEKIKSETSSHAVKPEVKQEVHPLPKDSSQPQQQQKQQRHTEKVAEKVPEKVPEPVKLSTGAGDAKKQEALLKISRTYDKHHDKHRRDSDRNRNRRLSHAKMLHRKRGESGSSSGERLLSPPAGSVAKIAKAEVSPLPNPAASAPTPAPAVATSQKASAAAAVFQVPNGVYNGDKYKRPELKLNIEQVGLFLFLKEFLFIFHHVN